MRRHHGSNEKFVGIRNVRQQNNSEYADTTMMRNYCYDRFRRATESIPTIRNKFCWQDESHLSIRGCATMMPTYALDANDTMSHPITGKERDPETGLDFFLARYYSGAQGRSTSVDPIWVTKERMQDPQRLNLYAYGRNNPLRFIDPDGMDITLGQCAIGDSQECFNEVLVGLRKEDRSHVHLIQGDGTNGFKKGQYGITVDADYNSDSGNFQTLQKLAGDHSATAQIEVLKPDDKFDVRVTVNLDVKTGQATLSTMSLTPGNPNDPNADSFVGYTFFPYGKGVPGPYSSGNFTDVVVNTVSPDGSIPSTIHHELRHVLLGDFGRVAPYGAHGTGMVDQSTTEAEKEAVKNSQVN